MHHCRRASILAVFVRDYALSLSHLDKTFLAGYIPSMEWEVEYADEFGSWWDGLSIPEQESVAAKVKLLEEFGPSLPRPHADVVQSSKHQNMKELRIQHAGRPYRVLFAFDPRRAAILLLGGDKTGNAHWYEENVPLADEIYDAHLKDIGEGQ